MTNLEFLKTELLKAVENELTHFSFQLNKSLAEFIRKNKEGWEKYQLIFLKRDNQWEINPAVLLRKNAVEDIFHLTSGFENKYQKGTPTIGSSIEDYKADRSGHYRFCLAEESQIDGIAQEIVTLFKEFALPFFDKYNTLESLDIAINENLNDTLLTGDIFKGSKGIILAKLTNRNDYDHLVAVYTSYYEKFAKGFYLPEFRNLLEILSQK